VTTRSARANLPADSKTCFRVSKPRRCLEAHCAAFRRDCVESNALRDAAHRVTSISFAAPTILRPARFWKRGGRANRRRCARWRRSPNVCRTETYSNMGTVGLCRNFSGEAFVSRSVWTREIGASVRQTWAKLEAGG